MKRRTVFWFLLWAFLITDKDGNSQYSDGFNYPVGPYVCKPEGSGYTCLDHIDRRKIGNFQDYKVDQTFENPNPDFSNKPHLGVDLNRETRSSSDTVSNGNRDKGDPVFAPSNGEVVYAQYCRTGWGNVVIIKHLAPSGSCGFELPRGQGNVDKVYTLYGHLQDYYVSVGDLVEKGDFIGTVGDADGAYSSCTPPSSLCAHLHYEVYTQDLLVPGDGYSWNTDGYVDPMEFTKLNRMIFGDVPDDVWFDDFVWEAVTSRIVNGEKTAPDIYGHSNPTGLYRPERFITKAEFVKIVLLARDIEIIPIEHALGPVFEDVPMSHALFEYVYTALFAGVIDDRESYFMPDEYINRGDAVEMLIRGFSFSPPDLTDISFPGHPQGANFFDLDINDFLVDINEWTDQAYYIKVAFFTGSNGGTRTGLISGYPDNTFRFYNHINRAEAAKIMCMAILHETPLY